MVDIFKVVFEEIMQIAEIQSKLPIATMFFEIRPNYALLIGQFVELSPQAVARRPKAKRRSVVLIDIGNQIEPNHEEQHQQIDPIPPPPEFADDPTPSVDIQQCPNCDVVIRGRYPSDLARHMKCHEPRQQCSRCEKMLALRSFKLHANKCVAVASPRFACADCDKSYATAKLLATHRRGKH
ncbi:hypothetical protein HA402_003536 [Bradysia odoriphaga]|nr:hypothetical protein HA402_003536 [Bradysia odoriphaga]